ncbi:MAG: dihydrofolate reductase [Propionibacteriales bacterium]|nr:dihydrofolate reductase [Propionibacteriales bacterium]
MGNFRFQIAVSLDGFVAGPDQSVENPLGVGGEALHDWVVELEAWRRSHGLEGGEVNASTRVVEEREANVGATVVGRNMFGGGPGPWGDDPWRGWWGDDPPFHTPVFVITHHPREPLEMDGGTTFHFVTDGIESALERAREAADGKDVLLGGGANVIQQYLAAGLVDEFELNVVPVVLGGGERLLENVGTLKVEQIRARRRTSRISSTASSHRTARPATFGRHEPGRPRCAIGVPEKDFS